MGTWLNSDGLFLKLGTDEATVAKGGEVPTLGVKREIEVKLDLTLLNTSTQVILTDTTALPKNARVEEVEVEVETGATSGGSATLDFGLIRYDRVTEYDYDGLVAAAAKATLDTAGKRLNLINGSTAAGAVIGTTTATYPCYFCAKAGTAVFTAGLLKIRVKYYFIS